MKLVREYINEKFTEKSDPIKDLEIGHDAQMAKLNKQFKWDWYPENYEFKNTEEIIDIIEYRGFHIKVSKIKMTYNAAGGFYIGIPDIGEPYTDGPYQFNTAKEALQSAKSGLDNYLDD